jgi:zinc/manganese transport system permease protein
MSDAFDLLWPPFLVALCLIGIHTYFGIEVLRRKVIFVDLALAQIAALGTTVAFMLGHAMQGHAAWLYSLGFTLVAAALLSFTPQWSKRLPQEALIGVIYVVAAAAAILLIDRAPQGAEHLKQILTGDILTAGADALRTLVPLYAAIGALHAWLRPRITAADGAWTWEFVFYASFGVVVTSSVALAGVLLVFSFLIIPACIGVLHADRLARQLAIGWITGALASAAGLAASYAFDLPTGAAMVCAFGGALALAGVVHPFRRGGARPALRRIILAARALAGVVLIGSGLLLLAAPRADQPLLDGLEAAMPSLRAIYLTRTEAAVFREAAEEAARHGREAERLNERERASRAGGAAIDDMELRKLSSFVRSYAEMRNGELFVMGEVRGRARERTRWWLGPLLAALGLAALPGSIGWMLARIRQRGEGFGGDNRVR